MAGPTLAVFLSSQFSESLFDIDRLGPLIDQAAARSLLTTCGWESTESTYGACDAVPCSAKATVYDTQTEQEYCAQHFREASRG